MEANGPGLENRDPVRETPDLVDPLCRPEDRRAFPGEIGDQLADDPSALRVEIVCCFVDQENGRLRQQRPRDGKALLHPVGVLAHTDLGRVPESDEPEHLE